LVHFAFADGRNDVYPDAIKPNASGSYSSQDDANYADYFLGDVFLFPLWFGVVLAGEQPLLDRAAVVHHKQNRQRNAQEINEANPTTTTTATTATAVAIVAIATAPGRGGVGVVRLSCLRRDALELVVERLLAKTLAELTPRSAHYLSFFDADKQRLDRGLAIYFPAPHSYTGEHVLELQGHGGPVILQLLLQSILACSSENTPIRISEPGEFTQRAFLNDKMDLAQAEAVADLIDASTEQAARQAVRSMSGEFSSAVNSLVEQLVNLRMLVEATLDFPEEEIDFLKAADAQGKLHLVESTLARILSQATQGALLREGLQVVLMGEPNVGKSSLLNALAGAEIAIVTPVAGTTRDKVSQLIQIQGVPVNVIDTAGLRDTEDEVEKIGIQRTRQAISEADVVVWLQDVRQRHQDQTILPAAIASNVPVLKVFNKVDLDRTNDTSLFINTDTELFVSAKNLQGIEELRLTLLRLAGWQQGEGVYLARERHLLALRAGFEHVKIAQSWIKAKGAGLELVAEELRQAQVQLSSITGEFTADDLLGVIFSRFCIGK
jgi:tRNA modification GTPase